MTSAAENWRIIAMVAPTMVPDNYVTALVAPCDMVTVMLDRFDIGHDEGTMSGEAVAQGVAEVRIARK